MEVLKIFSAPQIKEIDRLTIENQGITSLMLMERAVENLLPYVTDHLSTEHLVDIYAGVGNNGGDGLVLARKLSERGYNVRVWIVPFSSKQSHDFQVNFQRLKDAGVPVREYEGYLASDADVLIDAIFGVGLNRPAEGIAAEVIRQINDSGLPVYSIDMPSGLYADRPNDPSDPIVKATKVFTFQFPKLSFFFEENFIYVPEFEIVDIGLDRKVIQDMPTPYYYLLSFDPLPPRNRYTAKWDYGHAVIVGGSKGKAGAVCLAAKAAYRSGAGWTSVYVPENLCDIYQTGCPEIMCIPGKGKDMLEDISLSSERYAFGIGPGMGVNNTVANALTAFLKNLESAAVFDADALRILAENPRLLKDLPGQSVLTPHKFEFQRLVGEWNYSLEKIQKAGDMALQHNLILVLKGPYTMTTDGKEFYFNSSGNAALAKAGSGDILTGIITAFLAQKLPPLEAALRGVYVHGLAADKWVEENSTYTLTPQDMLRILGGLI